MPPPLKGRWRVAAMSPVETFKAAWRQRWFRLGVLAGLIVIGVFLPLASSNPDGLERTIESLIQPLDVTAQLMIYGSITGETGPLSAWLSFLGLQYLLRAPMPDYMLLQLAPDVQLNYWLEMIGALNMLGILQVEIPEEAASLLLSMVGGNDYLASLSASVIGFFITLGAAWLLGSVLRRKEA